jgi:hypothetical protein
MEKHDYLPYHQSLVKFLEIIELDSLESMGEAQIFVCRFRVESAVLLSHMQIVKIPEQELNSIAVALLSFYKGFMARYEHLMAEASVFSGVDERPVIENLFVDAADNLISRPSELPEILELETTNWFDVSDNGSRRTEGLKLAGQLLLNKEFSSEQIIALCRKAAWLTKHDGDPRQVAMAKTLKVECPSFYREYGNLFFKAWNWPSELTEPELAEMLVK